MARALASFFAVTVNLLHVLRLAVLSDQQRVGDLDILTSRVSSECEKCLLGPSQGGVDLGRPKIL